MSSLGLNDMFPGWYSRRAPKYNDFVWNTILDKVKRLVSI